jgi:hypothetical protein
MWRDSWKWTLLLLVHMGMSKSNEQITLWLVWDIACRNPLDNDQRALLFWRKCPVQEGLQGLRLLTVLLILARNILRSSHIVKGVCADAGPSNHQSSADYG